MFSATLALLQWLESAPPLFDGRGVSADPEKTPTTHTYFQNSTSVRLCRGRHDLFFPFNHKTEQEYLLCIPAIVLDAYPSSFLAHAPPQTFHSLFFRHQSNHFFQGWKIVFQGAH